MTGHDKTFNRRTALQGMGLLGVGSLAAAASGSDGGDQNSGSDAGLAGLPILFETDVLVVGGGAAGVCAAVAAARAGAATAIVERWPVLGGLATMAHVNIWHTSDCKREVIFGLTRELIQRLKTYDGLQLHPRFPREQFTYMFHPGWLTIVYDDLMRESKIRTLCYTPCVGAVVAGGKIRAAVVGTPMGLRQIRAKRFVDASGDGSLGFFAGCQTGSGRASDGKQQGMTQMMGFKGLDVEHRRKALTAEKPLRKRMEELRDQGKLPAFGPHWIGWAKGDGYNSKWRWGTMGTLACTTGDSLDNEDLTRAAMEARAKAPKFLRFYRENLPGCEMLELDWLAPALGVRESRRIAGLYQFTGEDIGRRRSFPDAVGHGVWPVDVHDPDGAGKTTWHDKSRHLEPGESYQIPYGILVAADVDNLLTAGRCASATHEGMAGLRVQTHCHIMGQAAGTAAAMSLDGGVQPADLDVVRLQKKLIDAGVLIDMDRTNKI